MNDKPEFPPFDSRTATLTHVLVPGSPTQTFTIERRIYYSRWRRVWYFLIGRCGYQIERYENCTITGISVTPTDEGQKIEYDFYVPPQAKKIHTDLRT